MQAVSSLARRAVLIAALVVTLGSVHPFAQDPRVLIKPEEVRWPPAAAGAAALWGERDQTVVLKGESLKSGSLHAAPASHRAKRPHPGARAF